MRRHLFFVTTPRQMEGLLAAELRERGTEEVAEQRERLVLRSECLVLGT